MGVGLQGKQCPPIITECNFHAMVGKGRQRSAPHSRFFVNNAFLVLKTIISPRPYAL